MPRPGRWLLVGSSSMCSILLLCSAPIPSRLMRRSATAPCPAERGAWRRGGPARPREPRQGRPCRRAQAQVARLNWYLPRYIPVRETARGLPPDSHWAIRASVAGRRATVPRRRRDAPARPSAPSVCGPATPSTASPLARWKRRTAAVGDGAVVAGGRDAQLALHLLHQAAAATGLQQRGRRAAGDPPLCAMASGATTAATASRPAAMPPPPRRRREPVRARRASDGDGASASAMHRIRTRDGPRTWRSSFPFSLNAYGVS